jgi:hypothetical protein
MRKSILSLAGALGVAAWATAASAAPVLPGPATEGAANIVQIAQGCGRGFHRDPWGRCVSHRYGYYPPRRYVYRPYYPGYYGGGYEPWNRPSPSDHIANQLNRQELGRAYYGY